MAPLRFQAGPQTDRKCVLPSDEELASKITETDIQGFGNVQHYSAIRRYTLHNSRLSGDAIVNVRLNYTRGKGDSFEVLGTENASGFRLKVLNNILESESEASKKEYQFEINKANYKFHATGTGLQNGHQCYVVDLIPNRKGKFLLQGKAWVDVTDYGIVRVEGRPAASLSFWVGKPYIVLDFEKVDGVWMAAHSRSESSSLLLGSSVLTIDFSGYHLESDTRVIAAEKLGTVHSIPILARRKW